MATPGTSDKGGFRQEACGNPSSKSRAEGGNRGAENREKRREKPLGGQARSMVFLPPSSSGVVGSRVGGGPGGGGQTRPGLHVAPLLASLNNDLLPHLLVTRDTAVHRGQRLLLGYRMCVSVTLRSLNVHQGQWGWAGPRTLGSERERSKNKRPAGQ